jgi:hypothetical protein
MEGERRRTNCLIVGFRGALRFPVVFTDLWLLRVHEPWQGAGMVAGDDVSSEFLNQEHVSTVGRLLW